MKNQQILSVINTSITFGVLPSEVMRLEDNYAAYCFDEACAYMYKQIQDGKTPKFEEDKDLVRQNPLLQKMIDNAG